MNCLVCNRGMETNPSWRDLFFMDKQDRICKECRTTFEPNSKDCRICGSDGTELCNECSAWETTEFRSAIDYGKVLFSYNAAMKDYLHQFKFLQDVILAEIFAHELAAAVQKTRAVAVPVPMNQLKLRSRTFAQVDSMLVAGGVSFQHLLNKNEEVQGEKTRQERMETRGLFTLNGNPVPKRIVLIDDMYTTGTTLRLAAKLLKDAGAEEVGFIALIRA